MEKSVRRMLFLLGVCLAFGKGFTQEEGLASYYHHRFHGRVSASGYVHDKNDYVAAHRTLPFGTYVRVTNLRNLKSVIVQITDRGPHRRKRIIDVSKSAAEALGFVRRGLAQVRIEVVPGPIDLRYLDLMYPRMPFLPAETYRVKPPLAFPVR